MSFALQVAANSLSAASVYILLALGFGLIFSTARFFHFAHGGVYTLAPYLVYSAVASVGSLPFAVGAGVAGAVCAGGAIELLLYRPLRRRGASSLVMLLASLGVFTILQNVIALMFGDDTKSIVIPFNRSFELLGARVTVVQVAIVASSVLLVSAVQTTLARTRIGWAMRAVGCDAELARITGIDASRVLLATMAVGSALGGVAGILVAMDSAMTPTMGMNALMMAVVVVIIGGIGNLSGTVAAALLLSFAQNLTSTIVSSLWQEAVAFGLLALFLILRPRGLLGSTTGRGR